MYTKSETEKALNNLPKGTIIDTRGDIMVARLPSRKEEIASRIAWSYEQTIPPLKNPFLAQLPYKLFRMDLGSLVIAISLIGASHVK